MRRSALVERPAHPSTSRARTVSAPAAAVAAAHLAMATLLLAGSGASGQVDGQEVLATTVDGPITPVIANHLADGIAQAARDRASAYLVRLDTPGGLDSSMRDIVQDILAADVPVVVYVSPQGARAASAGAIITFASHVAAMAPGTTIGAATPVGGGGGEDLDQKVVNDAAAYAEGLAELRGRDVEFAGDAVRDGRSIGASEARELGVVEVIADSEEQLLEAVDGLTVEVAGGREVELSTAGATLVEHDLGVLRTIQQFLADPNVAFLLLSIGTLGIIYELATPGIGAGGAVGVTCILLALFGLAVLPVDLVGVLFLVLAAVLFVVEVLAPGIGVAAAGGVVSLVLSGILLIDEDIPGLELSLAVVLPTAVLVGVFVVVAGRLALRARRAPSTVTGPGLFVGWEGPVRVTTGQPQAFVQGAWWRVRPRDRDVIIDDGATVEVVDVEGLDLLVVPKPESPHAGANQEDDR